MGINDWDDGVPAPRDVDGRLVSLDTEELFAEGDERVRVISFLYARGGKASGRRSAITRRPTST